jgi:hypothetical protein
MSSRTIYLLAFAVGAVGLLGSALDDDFAALLLPAGACLVGAAVLNRGRGRVIAEPGQPIERRPWFIRGGLIVIGCLWASMGIRALVV